LSGLLATGKNSFCGAIFDPTKHERHAELRDQILDGRLDAILDPRTIRSATLGGYTDAMGELPWGVGRQHVPEDFVSVSGRRLVSALASFACDNGFTQVMAPTHFIGSIDSPWLDIDVNSTLVLRASLDRSGGASIPLIYPLAISYALFRSVEERTRLINKLRQLPVASIWLSVGGQGRNSTAAAVQKYIDAARDFHSLGIPLVADHMGGAVGLSLLAFGAVGGIAHGFMEYETFSTSHWNKPQKKQGGFGKPRQIYVPAIDGMLSEKEAEILFGSRNARAHFGCNDTRCCPRGIKDMVHNHMDHFIYQRMKQVGDLSQMPESLRPQRFLEQHLRRATDRALAAAQVEWGDEKIQQKMQDNRKRLDKFRVALSNYAEKSPPRSFSLHPQRRLSRGG
jgi:hypothetical protein